MIIIFQILCIIAGVFFGLAFIGGTLQSFKKDFSMGELLVLVLCLFVSAVMFMQVF